MSRLQLCFVQPGRPGLPTSTWTSCHQLVPDLVKLQILQLLVLFQFVQPGPGPQKGRLCHLGIFKANCSRSIVTICDLLGQEASACSSENGPPRGHGVPPPDHPAHYASSPPQFFSISVTQLVT